MEGTYRKKEEPPPPSYDELYKPSNGGVDNVGVNFYPEDRNGHAVPDTSKKDDGEENDENNKKKKDEKEKPPMVPFTKLFHFADGEDKFLLFLAVFGAIANGAASPVQFIIFGRLVENLINFQIPSKKADLDLEGVMEQLAIYYIYLAVGTLVVAYLQTGLFGLTAVRQTKKMRTAFFNSVMRQNIGWFDTYDVGELNSRLTDDINKVAEGIGSKVGMAIQFTVTFFAGFAIGFVYSWKLTLVILSLTPLMIIAGGIMGKVISVFTSKELDAYAKAGAVAEEVLSSIKTVAAFGGEEKEQKRYAGNLGEARAYGIKKGLSVGLGFGFFQLIMFGSYALAFWFGSTLVVKDEINGGDLLVVFFSVLVGATQLGQAGPNMEAIATARGAAYELYAVIEREPPIDISSEEGEKPDDVDGEIEFKDVHFVYPSRADVKVLNGLNLSVSRGQTVALVGESGCGKSTTVKLVQRFYDPESGMVLLDNKDIKTLNLSWLRQHIGVVSQEPVLFATTIAENIRYGQDGIGQEDIERATKMANAHDFIQNLPQGYETLVGERGAQLSGGQKQRIAIARALVRNPKILLLDEATSALDTESESVVQAALDKAREGRTTIVIAHRLSTVRNADQIAAFQDGVIAELGTHSELMEVDGVYKQLVTLQTFESDENGDEAEIEKSTEDKETAAAVKFVRSMSGESDHEPSNLERQVSRRASRRLSKHRPGSALSRQDSHVGSEKKGKIVEEKVEPAPALRIMKMNTQEWPYMVLGTIGAIGNGVFPMVFALILGEILNVFTLENEQELKDKALFWSMMFLAFGAFSFFTQLFQNYMFAYSGELLTVRLRDMAFKALLRQEMAFFDDQSHSTGALTTALATHASDVKGATGVRLGTVAMTITTIISSLVYAFINGWKLTLLVLAFLPFIAIAGALQIKTFVGDDKNKDEMLESGKVAVEAFENVRTIATLGKEKTFCEAFYSTLLKPYKKAVRSAHLYGLSYGLMESIMFLCNAASFRFGAFLMVRGEMNMMEVMKVVMCIVIMGMMFGQVSGFSPDYVKAKIAAARLFKLFDRVPLIDSSSDLGLTPTAVQGTVNLRSVRFRYPTRPDVKVLRGINLEVKTGQTVALVGSSGCGKSTVVSLLERFYDAEDGEVAIDGTNVQTLNIKWLRSKMGIVSQEPVLFGFSIAENIAYGDNSREVSMEEIEAAARSSNIHSFINSLPKGYDTLVGDKGTLISGGQKQRIAIARALIRNPQILLLDEATSALDTESERVVQDALDAASEGRTVIVIAHRLSTVKNADKIAVIHHGRVAEEGTHQELIAFNGLYAGLVSAQMVNENA